MRARSAPSDPGTAGSATGRTFAAVRRGGIVRFRRVSPIPPRSRKGPLTEPIADAQPRSQERVLMPDIVEKVLEQNSRGIFCRRLVHLSTNNSHTLCCSNNYFTKLAILREIPTFSTISPLNRLCPIGVGSTQVWGADVVISRDDANSKVGVPGNFLDDLLHASDRPTCRRLDGDPELHVRDRDEIDCRVEGRVEDQLNAGCNRTVRCYCDVPVGLHPILGALTATRKNVLEG